MRTTDRIRLMEHAKERRNLDVDWFEKADIDDFVENIDRGGLFTEYFKGRTGVVDSMTPAEREAFCGGCIRNTVLSFKQALATGLKRSSKKSAKGDMSLKLTGAGVASASSVGWVDNSDLSRDLAVKVDGARAAISVYALKPATKKVAPWGENTKTNVITVPFEAVLGFKTVPFKLAELHGDDNMYTVPLPEGAESIDSKHMLEFRVRRRTFSASTETLTNVKLQTAQHIVPNSHATVVIGQRGSTCAVVAIEEEEPVEGEGEGAGATSDGDEEIDGEEGGAGAPGARHELPPMATQAGGEGTTLYLAVKHESLVRRYNDKHIGAPDKPQDAPSLGGYTGDPALKAVRVLAIDMPSGCDRLLQKVDDLYPGFRNLEASGWNPAWNTEWCPGPGPYNSRELGIPTAAAKDPAAFDRRNGFPELRERRAAAEVALPTTSRAKAEAGYLGIADTWLMLDLVTTAVAQVHCTISYKLAAIAKVCVGCGIVLVIDPFDDADLSNDHRLHWVEATAKAITDPATKEMVAGWTYTDIAGPGSHMEANRRAHMFCERGSAPGTFISRLQKMAPETLSGALP
jgi:hypothetical protein